MKKSRKKKTAPARSAARGGERADRGKAEQEEALEDLAVSEEEEAAGFAVRTLRYPENYELPNLEDEDGRRLERAVAILIDDVNRIKRCQSGDGYVHEVFDGEGWSVAEEFAALDDVLISDLYGRWKVEAEVEETEDVGEEEQPEE
jgi:hypothetical protein